MTLDPQLALALFVAPVLLDAAFDSSQRDLRDNWRVVTGLALIAVGLTVAAVAVVARWMVPTLPWAAAIALGPVDPADAHRGEPEVRHVVGNRGRPRVGGRVGGRVVVEWDSHRIQFSLRVKRRRSGAVKSGHGEPRRWARRSSNRTCSV